MSKEKTSEIYILAADIGKYETKMIGREIAEGKTEEDLKKVHFRTKIYNLSDGYIDVQGNSYQIEYDGQEYIIGEQGQEKSYDTSKTNLLHRTALYTAISQNIKPDTNTEVYLVLACPLSVIQIAEAKEAYKTYMKNEGEIKIKVNGKNYRFTIKEIMVKAEGSGITALEPNLFKNKTVGIVDLGGLNMGFSLYINSVCKKEDRFTEECGTDRLILLVKEQLAIYKQGNLTSTDIAEKALLEGGIKSGGKLDIKSMPFIEKAKENYFKEVMQHIKAHKYNVDEMDMVIFVGGTSQHINNNITNEIEHAYIPLESQMTTVNGLYKVAYKKYGKPLE